MSKISEKVKSKTNKVLIITNIPTPYRIPLFNEVKRILEQENISLKVVFGGFTYSRRKWEIDLSQCQFEYQILKSKIIKLGNSEKTMFVYTGLIKLLFREKPDISIVIGFSLATLKLYLYSILFKKPFIIWTGSIASRRTERFSIRNVLRRFIAKKASGFIAYGSHAKEYLISLGAPAEKIEIAINTTDVNFFKRETEIYRNKMVPINEKYILYVGYLTQGKRIDQLFEAIKLLKLMRNDFRLIIVGDGDCKIKLIDLAKKLEVDEMIEFEGFKQKNDLPDIFAKSNCFVFPSEYDIWGLVIVEAMAAGLPCLSSIKAGATKDLIEEGRTGFAIDFKDALKVAEKLNWILNHPLEARKIGENASEFIYNNVNLTKSATGFMTAINKLLIKQLRN